MSTLKVSWGPQHPMSGQLRLILEIDGDIVVKGTPDIGYTHRGIEKIAENRTYLQNVPIMERICNLDSFNLSLGYVMAVEELLGVEVPERAKFIRTIMAELGRIMSHLYWLSLLTVGGGWFVLLMWAIVDREMFLDLAEMVTGNRVTYAYFIPGGVREDLPPEFEKRCLKTLDYFERRLTTYDEMVYGNKTLQLRTKGIGVLRPSDAIELGATGPNLRGSGLKIDTRKDEPYAAYDQVDFEIPTEKEGDCYARARIRFHEMRESVSIIRQALKRLPDGPVRQKVPPRVPAGEAYSRVEAGRGELGYYIISDGTDKPYRVKISTPTFRNVFVASHLLKGTTVADVPMIFYSFDIFPLDIDR